MGELVNWRNGEAEKRGNGEWGNGETEKRGNGELVVNCCMNRFVGQLMILILLMGFESEAQNNSIRTYDIEWKTQSKNSSESMPCGGGDIGANVWVENNDILIYAAQSGWFDENNQMLKAGRISIKISPNPFDNQFLQRLLLEKGQIIIKGKSKGIETAILIWVDVNHPVLHIDISSNTNCIAEIGYETWRADDRLLNGKEKNSTSYKWVKGFDVITKRDIIEHDNTSLWFYHQNDSNTVVNRMIAQQGLSSKADSIENPLSKRISGGMIIGSDLQFTQQYVGSYAKIPFIGYGFKTKNKKLHTISFALQTSTNQQEDSFLQSLKKTVSNSLTPNNQKQLSEEWWTGFWNRSYITTPVSDSNIWKMTRNYQLFRYMLAANAYGKYPTKFNGGLFTFDPVYTDTSIHGTADFRNWGGGIFTAQNQRLVYWPMLKSGDASMMKPAFDFYNRLLPTAELRSRFYWGHAGACFTEQMENSGLPNFAEYGAKRPADFDKGVEYNAWLEYEWDTALEFCMMILESATYTNENIKEYIPLIKSCLIFFDEHYQYLAKKRGSKTLNENGELILYPSSAGETFKMANNPSSVIAALRTVTAKLLVSGYLNEDDKHFFSSFSKRIPQINLTNNFGKTTIAPAKTWERVNNTESMQLYPVFPWGIFSVGKPHLDVAINTYQLDTFALKFRSHVGWKQDNIFAARLGLTSEAFRLNNLKLKDGPYRFPSFWGPGYDWSPDHNWGASGMIGLQEMLMQTPDSRIILFPAWPREKDISFKLHAPLQTTVEVILKNGEVKELTVTPSSRKKDVILAWDLPQTQH